MSQHRVLMVGKQGSQVKIIFADVLCWMLTINVSNKNGDADGTVTGALAMHWIASKSICGGTKLSLSGSGSNGPKIDSTLQDKNLLSQS